MNPSIPGVFGALVTLCVAGASLGADVLWTGGGADDNWATAANWDGGAMPGATDTAVLRDAANGVTSILTNDAVIGGFNLRANQPETPRYAAVSHVLDLDGHVLAVNGVFTMAMHYDDGNNAVNEFERYARDASLVVRGGTLRIGAEGAPQPVALSQLVTDRAHSHLLFESGSTFDAWLSGFYVGDGYRSYCSGGTGLVDFRSAALAGDGQAGLFRAPILQLGGNGWGGAGRTNDIEILFGPSLQRLEIPTRLSISDGQISCGFLGQYGGRGTAPMPGNVDILVGTDAEQRADVFIGRCGWSNIEGYFVPGEGGVFTGFVGTLVLGHYAGGGNSYCRGVIDLTAMDSAFLDVTDATIGKSSASNAGGEGKLLLPTGEAVFGSLAVGDDFGSGLLVLEGGRAQVGTSLAIGATGVVSNEVDGVSGGLDLAADASVSVAGAIRIVFAGPDASAGANGVYWGLRAAGDRRVMLSELQTAGKLSWDDSQIPGSANLFYDADAGYTYVAHRADGAWGAMVIARPATVEVQPGVPTDIVLSLDDLDASPLGQAPEARFLSCAQGTVSSNGTVVTIPGVTLGEEADPATYTVTLTYTKNGIDTSDDAIVTVKPVAAPTGSALAWAGGASLALMPRPEWLWGANWQGGVAPAAETAATLSFGNEGAGTNRVETHRRVGGLAILGDNARHTFDLDGNTLLVTNGAIAVGSTSYGTAAVFTNGTLALADADLSVVSKAGTTSGLVLSGTTLDADLRTLLLNSPNDPESGVSILDLRGARLADGTLAADTLRMARGYNNLYIDAATGLTNLVLRSSLVLGSGYWSGAAHLGDPADGHRLPAGVSISVGSPESADGLLQVGGSYVAGGDVHLTATAGGTFQAWVRDVTVGYSDFATLDLAAMDSVRIRTPSFTVGSDGSAAYGGGRVRLPAGDVETGLLRIGMKQADSSLDLVGTAFRVTGAITGGVHYVSWDGRPGDVNATIRTYVGDASCGLDLAEGVPMVFGENGTLQIFFEGDPGVRPLVGFRAEGDRVAEMEALVAGGKILVDSSGLPRDARVFVHRGRTCIGLPPAAGTLFLLR
ncbi:MAG: hypothetical protein ACOX5G_04750 [Kiritimatiellia bacterium]|jgi:hypothetical protein